MSTETKAMMTVDRVAEVTGLTRADIYRVSERKRLGVPAHFVYANGVVAFSLAGLGQLAEGMQEEHATAAKALLFDMQLARQRAAGAGGLSADDAEARRIAARWDRQHEGREDAA